MKNIQSTDINRYETIVGLEIHVELDTATKMFCRCSVPSLQDKPNTKTCPVCLGLPGALPYPNKEAIESCIKIGLALNCSINKDSFFERKNYFYPDLAKGFQTSQYLLPFAEKGYLEIDVNGQKRKIGITRVHMEEDTGKLTHSIVDGKEVSLIDFNRSSVPLVEIVTEPDIRTAEEARIFLTELQKIVRYLGVSDADMEKGHMRLEPNISLRSLSLRGTSDEAISKDRHANARDDSKKLPPYKVEVKNINSFKFVEKAILFEEKRHAELLSNNQTPTQETRGWNEFKNITVSQRSKEEAHDYRYFPEPDIPPINFTENEINKLKNQVPELPIKRALRFVTEYNLTDYNSEILTREKALADFFEDVAKLAKEHKIEPKEIANHIINKKVKIEEIEPAGIVKMLVSSKQTSQVDETKLEETVKIILNENPKAVEDFKSGKEQIIGFLIGKTRQKLPEATDTNQIRNKILQMLQ